MKQIKVLGPGCARCETLARLTREAADQIGVEYELEKITDFKRFIEFGVMMTPGLVIDGELRLQGRVPSMDEIKAMLA